MGAEEATRPAGPPGDEPAIGTTLGRYILLEPIGAGGMGAVYLAHDPELERNVALKLLPRTEPGSDRRERLWREAKAMALVAHPHIATVHDIGLHGEHLFIAMEFVDGWSLKAWLRQGRSWQQTVEVFLQAGRGLAAAHDKGIVHRDFKPGNVMIGRDGRARIVDFGLAQPSNRADDPRASGTPAYMSPEQRLGHATDARSDQFSFCLALWEGLYGERPFAADDPESLSEEMLAERRRPVPPDSSVPDEVHAVLERGLAGDATQRFPSMGALLDALQSTTEGPSTRRARHRDPHAPDRFRRCQSIVASERLLLAHDRDLDRDVGLSLPAVDELAVDRGVRVGSIRSLFSLSHPRVASVLDAGIGQAGHPYFVLDLPASARPLTDWKGTPPRAIAEQLRRLLEALEYLHGRDWTLGNLGREMVLETDAEPLVLIPVTHTPCWSWLAPERLMGRPQSIPADLYAVGALAFEMLSGAPPYPGETWEEATDAVLSRGPDFTALAEGPMHRWVRTLLSKRPEQRHQSARAAREELQRAVPTASSRGAPPSSHAHA